jgi:hypothetical protein
LDKHIKVGIKVKKIAWLFFWAINITGIIYSIDIDEARELLMKEKGGEIFFLSKINLGISGGENWIANRMKDDATYIYTIDSDKKVTFIDAGMIMEQSEIQDWDPSSNSYRDLEFNILEGVPGIQLGSKAARFGDFDGDGKDEIFIIRPSFEPHGYKFYIKKYSDSEKKMIFPFGGNFGIYYFKGPHPVFITKYQGKYCIAVEPELSLWCIFAWNEETNEYEKIKEIGIHEIDFSTFEIIEEDQNESEPEIARSAVITTENKQEDVIINSNNKNGQFIITAIIIVIITVAIMFVFLTIKKKRKK